MKRMRSTKADETPEFREFWDAWRPMSRPTDGRGEARDTFLSHIADGVDPQDIVDGARYFLRNLKDKDFIPLASTWLNKRAYEDLADSERDFQRRLEESRQRSSQTSANVVQMARPVASGNTAFLRKFAAMKGEGQ